MRTVLFCGNIDVLIVRQFSLHLGCMVYAVARSKEYLEEGYEPDLDGEFKPNMINSVVFLVGAVQQVFILPGMHYCACTLYGDMIASIVVFQFFIYLAGFAHSCTHNPTRVPNRFRQDGAFP